MRRMKACEIQPCYETIANATVQVLKSRNKGNEPPDDQDDPIEPEDVVVDACDRLDPIEPEDVVVLTLGRETLALYDNAHTGFHIRAFVPQEVLENLTPPKVGAPSLESVVVQSYTRNDLCGDC